MKKLYFTSVQENEASVLSYLMENYDRTNDKQRERMKKLLEISIRNELTERQRQCIVMKFYDKMKTKEIADTLNIKEITVYKHIQRGIAAMKRVAVYL